MSYERFTALFYITAYYLLVCDAEAGVRLLPNTGIRVDLPRCKLMCVQVDR